MEAGLSHPTTAKPRPRSVSMVKVRLMRLSPLLCGGAMVSLFGARVTLFVAGAVPAAAGLIGLALYARLKRDSPAMSPPAPAEGL